MIVTSPSPRGLFARGCPRLLEEAASVALRVALPCLPNVTAFAPSRHYQLVVKPSKNQVFSCEFFDGYEELTLEVLMSCRLLSCLRSYFLSVLGVFLSAL